ncbi:MAG: hypothetical protein HY904_16855 [Deltaproteobacteria bacterium]|nr:hypothetical protein [Deltaproteobacteria bacterium]
MSISNVNRGTGLNTPSVGGSGPVTGTTTPAPATTQTPAGTGDGFSVGGTARAPAQTPAQKEWGNSVNRYQDRLNDVLGNNAQAFANAAAHGTRTPAQGGDITDAQRDQLVGATKDLMMDMPVSMLAPSAQKYLADKGLDVPNLGDKKLKDLGKVGGDLAKDLAEKFRKDSPGAFYGLAAAGAVGAGAYGYLKGSEALGKLGIKPEFKTRVFSDHLTLRASAAWEEKFSNFRGTVGAESRFGVGGANVTVGAEVTAGVRNGLESYKVNGSVARDGTTLSGSATFDGNSVFQSGNLSLSRDTRNVDWALSGNFGQRGHLDSLGASVSVTEDKFRLSAGAEHNFVTNTTTGNLGVTYRPRENVDLGLSAFRDSTGNSGVGVGVKISF